MVEIAGVGRSRPGRLAWCFLLPAAVFALACTHLALRDWETALGFFQATAESAPSWPTPRLAEHRCLLILGRRAEAGGAVEAGGLAVAGLLPADLAVGAGVWNYADGPASAVKAFNAKMSGGV